VPFAPVRFLEDPAETSSGTPIDLSTLMIAPLRAWLLRYHR
jgi:hypothetical protein